jgi:glycosyltransferase involved in cell wall biosynthesis
MRQAAKQARSPKVSVVITCYNLANTLPRAVASVQKQEDFDPAQAEIVIVNDNSPDDTADVAARIAAHPSLKNPIKIVTNEENLYLSESLNAGIAAASGKYIVPLDADNELGPRALRVLGDALDKDRGLHIAYGAMEVIDEAGVNTPFISTWPPQFNYVEQMRHHNQLPSASMYRRSLHQRIGGYRRRCRTAEDADFWCRATSFGGVPRRITDAVCLIYHDRSDSMSHVEHDWDWTAWYSWAREARRTPFGAAQNNLVRVSVPSFEPALITVVIPVGPGHAKYVIDAIDSLVAQTYVNWRCIVVWDSPEEVPYLPPFVHFIGVPKSGQGPAYARNRGIEASTTPLFLPLDADDYLQPEALAALLAAFKTGKTNEYYYSDWYVQETGVRSETPEFDCESVKRKMPHAVTALYTKESWEKIGGFDENLESWEDWDFLISLVKAGYCGVRVPHALFYYRMQAGQRREQKYAAKEINAAVLAAKHTILTETTPMGCGCGGGRPRTPVISNGSVSAAPPGDDMVKLEFQGNGGARTYKGLATGREYRFGADQSHKWRYVHQSDAQHLLLRPEFKISEVSVDAVVVSETRLEAVGPPVRA